MTRFSSLLRGVFALCGAFFFMPVQAATKDVAFGAYHAVALRDDGRVLTWGLNSSGQLGRGDWELYSDSTPQTLPQLDHIVQVAAGAYYSVALKQDGTVWMLGGTPSEDPYAPYVPVQRTDLPPIAKIAAGSTFQLFLTADGDLWCLGSYACGSAARATSPVLVLGNVRHIAAGAFHALAVDHDGVLYAWGGNQYGQLGNGTKGSGTDVYWPAMVMDGVAGVAAGYASSFATVVPDGAVWAWGGNGQGWNPAQQPLGMLCTGDTTDWLAPRQVAALPNGAAVTGIAAGGFNLFLKGSDGRLYACGDNRTGKLGVGVDRDVLPYTATPMPVPGIASFDPSSLLGVGMNNVAIARNGCQLEINGYNGFDLIDPASNAEIYYSFASGTTPSLCAPRTVASASMRATLFGARSAAWGVGETAQVGTGVYPLPIALPEAQPVALASGWQHALALRADGTVWGWGANPNGELGFAPGICSSNCAKRQMPGIDGVAQIVAATDFSLLRKTDGTVWITGRIPPNGTVVHTPTRIAGIDGVTEIVGGGAGDAAYGGAVFMKTAAGWYGMGTGKFLGRDIPANETQPVMLHDLAGFASVRLASAFPDTVCGQKQDASLWCWGSNNWGALGNGGFDPSFVPVPVLTQDLAGGGPIVSYAVGAYNGMALTLDGRVWVWGSNFAGQMGIGLMDDGWWRFPRAVYGISAVGGTVMMGYNSLFVLPADCSPVQAWGFNINGQLGRGNRQHQGRPGPVLNSAGNAPLDLCQ